MQKILLSVAALYSLVFVTPGVSAEALTLSGKVTKNGAPARYARLYVSGLKQPIRADETGSFSVTVASPGSYTITPLLQSNFISVPLNRMVSVTSGGASELNFTLSRATEKATIRGRALGPSGAPISNASVHISGAGKVNTDANGVFVRTGLAAGSYTLTATAAGSTFSPALRKVKATIGRASRTNFRGKALPPGAGYATYLSGLYTVMLSRTSGQCSTLPSTVSGNITVVQSKDQVKVSLPTLGSATFKASNSGFSGAVSKRRQGCKLAGNIAVNYSSQYQASVLGDVVLSCPGKPNCNGEYQGILMRK